MLLWVKLVLCEDSHVIFALLVVVRTRVRKRSDYLGNSKFILNEYYD